MHQNNTTGQGIEPFTEVQTEETCSLVPLSGTFMVKQYYQQVFRMLAISVG